ncbi:actin filament-associated protein 1 isoform X3 [Pantherophis guttatus]|uniref:Actin filament-associated protein 1 n=1 Tax=Pantherophis guttatus TaxID=94885 RepID=A0A6P9B8K0_PANGU|nr:actin filament-associated protein 1 isoform X3 [Pantherophis guttatus]
MQLSLGVGGPAWSRSPTLGEIGEVGSPGAAFIPFCLVPGYGSGARLAPAMEELIVELQLFLQLLDHEYLTSTVREKKAVLNNILLRIQATKDFEVKENVQRQEIAINLPAPPQMPLPEIPQQWLPPDNGPPPLPSSSLPEGYYEEAVPLSPGKAPEYITSNYDSDAMSSSYESYDEEDEDGKGKKMRHQWPSEEASMDLVKDAKICAFLLRKKRFGQWTKLLCVIKENKLLCYKSSKEQQPQMELLLCDCSITYIPKDSKKKKHELKIAHQGQDALVLAVQSKEQADQWLKVIKEVCSTYVGTVESDGTSSNSVYKTDLEKKLSLERPSSDGEGVVENGITNVCNGKEHVKRKKSSKVDSKGTVPKVTGKKITKIIGLGKKKPSTDEQTSSAEEDIPTCGYLNVLSNNRWRERWCRVKDNKLILHKDRTDLKTHIVSIPLRGCEVIPGLDSKHPLTFRLLRNGQEVAVLEASSSEDMGRWIGILLAESGSSADPGTLHYDYIDVDVTASVIQAAKQTFCFMNRRVLSTNPYRGNAANGYACPSGMALHYDDVPCINGSWEPEDGFPTSSSKNTGEDGLYDNMGVYDNLPSPKIFARCPPAERKANRLSTDKLSSNHYKQPISSNLSSAQSVTNTSAVGKGSVAQFKGKKMPVAANGISGKGRTLSNSPKKSEFASNVKRSSSNADQYKYGKNRVEADAKRLQTKEEELLKKKEILRNHLAQLRKERKDLRAALEMNPGRKSLLILEDKLKKLEEECKLKESERVSLELELTEVKENLKKALAGGITLGLAIEPKSRSLTAQSPVLKHQTLENSPISSCDTSDTECSMPVNSAIVLKRHSSSSTSPCRGHVLQKAKEWEMKNGT